LYAEASCEMAERETAVVVAMEIFFELCSETAAASGMRKSVK
jgi:hypothetical protein